MTKSPRAELYVILAELFAEPPDWISLPGNQWPLFETLKELSIIWEEAQLYLDRLIVLDSESLVRRRERYAALFTAERPHYWLNESAALTKKILGKQTFELARLYQAAGLEVNGAELPDNISLELSFLAHIVGEIKDSSLERQFLEFHSSWMVNLGKALSKCGDQVYALVGALCADFLQASLNPSNGAEVKAEYAMFPIIHIPENCILCGFCAQVCPTHALKVLETRENTMLVLNAKTCIHCGKCDRICEFHVIKMENINSIDIQNAVLCLSPIEKCKICSQPIVSMAEMHYIKSQVGDANWLHLCLECRTKQTIDFSDHWRS